MNWDWQNAIVAGVVALALGYLARRVWLFARARRQAACGACGSCADDRVAGQDGFVPLDTLHAHHERKSQ